MGSFSSFLFHLAWNPSTDKWWWQMELKKNSECYTLSHQKVNEILMTLFTMRSSIVRRISKKYFNELQKTRISFDVRTRLVKRTMCGIRVKRSSNVIMTQLLCVGETRLCLKAFQLAAQSKSSLLYKIFTKSSKLTFFTTNKRL